jgi:threonyl-tRNA synthetase
MSIDQAIDWAKQNEQPYKVELLNDLKRAGTTAAKELDANELGLEATGSSKVEKVSFYRNGDFTDLCRGPHVESTGKVGAFKLMRVSGAYWRGNEHNPQMQRVYGVAFATKEDLSQYLEGLEIAKARDHRKLGQELDLFTFSDLVGPGLPLYTPRGTIIIEELKNALKDISRRYDMLPVSIPHLAKLELYEISGHAQKFADELFRVKSHYDQEFVLKPVNCPHHTQIYASRRRSYRDLPLRYIEQTMQYRDEKPGQIGGLQRTRGFTVDDGHTFCRVDQIEQEASMLVEVIEDFYKSLGLWGQHWVSLSVRDPALPDKYIGEPADWNKAEDMLDKVAKKYGLNAKRMVGEAALYGPKIDFMFKDSLGRETQLATIQLDFAMPKRFGLTYTDQNDQEQVPVMIHRAILGSFERFIMLLIEHFAGKFPVWLAPEQIRLATVNQEKATVEFAEKIARQARELGVRLTLDDSNESVGKKIRTAEVMKVPYTVVIGDKEINSGELSVRVRKDLAVSSEAHTLSIDELLNTIVNESKSRTSKTSI